MATNRELAERRKQRLRTKLAQRRNDRPRLSVFRSSKHIYAQIIDDTAGKTVAAASSLDKDLKGKSGATVEAASAVGALLAKRATESGATEVVFDRGGYLFHGRVKALAEAAREGGLQF
ncbi:MAG: 50S ribosomal protein L18 [Pseudomonadota bacterium]